MKRTMKTFLSLVLIIAMLPLSVFTANALYESDTDLKYPLEGGYVYLDPRTHVITGCDTTVTKAIIPEKIQGVTVNYIGSEAFYDCKILNEVSIPDSVEEIWMSAFLDCTALKKIMLSSKLTTIEANAFGNCTGLTEITIPDAVTFIDSLTFRGCSGLNSIRLPKNLRIFMGSAFEDCDNLTQVTVHPDNPLYASVNNVIYSKDLKSLVLCPAGKQGRFDVPSHVTALGYFAFDTCKKLKEITIPDSVTEIGMGAFYGCTGLTTVQIPTSVTSVLDSAFSRCTGLTSINLPDSVTTLGIYSFSDCTNLRRVALPGNLGTVPVCIFQNCSNLKSITLPENVKKIAGGAFENCTALTDVYFPGREKEWNKINIEEGNEALANVEIHFEEVGPDRILSSFHDIPGTAWYVDALSYAVSEELMNGVEDGKFAPESNMTRSMLVTVLWRYAGNPSEGTNGFSDVPKGVWYERAVAWASANGIVNGVGQGKFDPNGNITREQLGAILYRFAALRGRNTEARGDLSVFPDRGQVSPWAEEAMGWAVGERLINGSDGSLLPQGNATRAQVAAILMRYIEGNK